PGKKLIFMSGEFGQREEWDCNKQLNWHLINYENHQGIMRLVKDLNILYTTHPEMYENESFYECFQWIDFSDVDNSVISFLRWNKTKDRFLIFIFNFTPVPRYHYKIGVPRLCNYMEILNSDSSFYGGANMGNLGFIPSSQIESHLFTQSIEITIPPLAFLVLQPEQNRI
ncbi:MAG TPA: alpha amylase C-terminal domain-containing protein, partial [bacterium]|nr:alpha amylase C-terminal domain-containing protein [bacterium]